MSIKQKFPTKYLIAKCQGIQLEMAKLTKQYLMRTMEAKNKIKKTKTEN
jgi:hypothetical protein